MYQPGVFVELIFDGSTLPEGALTELTFVGRGVTGTTDCSDRNLKDG